MFKSHELVVKMQKKPKHEENPNQTAPMSQQQKINYIYEIGMAIDYNINKVAKALILYKAATTALRAAEHIVVTKVK